MKRPAILEGKFKPELLKSFSLIPTARVWNAGVAKFKLPGADGEPERNISFGIPGQADISGITTEGFRIEVEVKAASGKRTPLQVKWAGFIESRKGVYMLAKYDAKLDMKSNVASCTQRLAALIEDRHRFLLDRPKPQE